MLDEAQREELIERMRALIARWGPERYVAAPILEPSDAFFPDPYTPDLRGLRGVARRLLAYAGLASHAVEVDGADRASDDPLAQTLVTLADVDERRVALEVWGIGAAEEVPLVLAHEVARAYLALRGTRGAAHPYRAPAFEAEEPPDLDAAHEEEVSLTACYLGFGLLVAMGAHRYKAHGQIHGYFAVTRYVHECLGALTVDEAAFLLAAQAVARGVDQTQVDAWADLVSVNVRRDLGRYVEALEADRGGLLEALGLPDEAEWPEPEAPRSEPLPDDGWEPDAPDAPPPEHAVVRLERDRAWPMTLWSGALAGLAAGGALVYAPDALMLALLGGPAVTLGAYFAGRRLRGAAVCSACETALEKGRDHCTGCAGRVVASVAPGGDALAALERADVALTHDGAIAAPQEDADPRYVERGVKCPTCGWIPDGERHWWCDECEGEPFNTFEHGGECPVCAKVFDEVDCPRCDHLGPYDWWWPRDE